MKSLVKVMLVMALFFVSMFAIAKLTGFLDFDQISVWLQSLKETSSTWVGVVIILLLFADLFIAVPTLSLSILSGYLLGFEIGALCAALGMTLAGFAGYFLSASYGTKILNMILKKEDEREDLRESFGKHGFTMILLARAAPMFPEITACLSGITKMKFSRFAFAWLASAIPYAAVAAFAGSVSSLDNPKPAIFAAIGMTIILWGSWFVFSKKSDLKLGK